MTASERANALGERIAGDLVLVQGAAISAAIHDAVLQERETCAKIAETWSTELQIPLKFGPVYVSGFGKPIAAAIGSRPAPVASYYPKSSNFVRAFPAALGHLEGDTSLAGTSAPKLDKFARCKPLTIGHAVAQMPHTRAQHAR